MNEGFLKIDRANFDGSPAFCDRNHIVFKVFFYLFMKANHADGRLHGEHGILAIQRGQHFSNATEILAGLKNIVTQRQVKTAINRLKKIGELETKDYKPIMVMYTLVNYDKHIGLTKSKDKSSRRSVNEVAESSHHKGIADTQVQQSVYQNDNNTEKTSPATNKNDNTNKNIYSEDDKERFEKFKSWIVENCPSVAKMKEPFTINEFAKLILKHNWKIIAEIAEDMENWEGLSKRSSAFKTFNTFYSRRKTDAA